MVHKGTNPTTRKRLQCNPDLQDLALDDRRDFIKKKNFDLSVWLTTSILPMIAIKNLQYATSAARNIQQNFMSRPHPAEKVHLIRPTNPKLLLYSLHARLRGEGNQQVVFSNRLSTSMSVESSYENNNLCSPRQLIHRSIHL